MATVGKTKGVGVAVGAFGILVGVGVGRIGVGVMLHHPPCGIKQINTPFLKHIGGGAQVGVGVGCRKIVGVGVGVGA